MKKQYITPTIKGHIIITPRILCGSEGLSDSMDNEEENDGNNSKRATRGCFFDDEVPAQSAAKEHDFAYGL